jgi:hypothetical protein
MEDYPLHWPPHIKRSGWRDTSRFKTTWAKAKVKVRNSLRLFAIDSGKRLDGVVINSNFLNGARPDDPGVALYFTWDNIPICIAVDRYRTPGENLTAIYHVIEARRTEMRHGTLELVRASLQGFRALPPPNVRSWRDVLNIKGPATREMVSDAYRKLAAERHPDRGGSDAMMAELNHARDDALREVEAEQAVTP